MIAKKKQLLLFKKKKKDNYVVKLFNSQLNHYNYIVFLNNFLNIIVYNIDISETANEIINDNFSCNCFFDYTFDYKNNKDLLLYRACEKDNHNIKIYDLETSELFLEIKNLNSFNYLDFSILTIIDEKNYLIVASNNSYKGKKSENVKIIDFNKNLIHNIENTNLKTFFIIDHNDGKFNYIIIGNEKTTIAYIYKLKSLLIHYDFKKEDENKLGDNINGALFVNNNNVLLIIQYSFGAFRIWNFNNPELLKKFDLKIFGILPFCLVNENQFLFHIDREMRVMDLRNCQDNQTIKYDTEVKKIETIFISKYGSLCIIIQDTDGFVKIYSQ